MFLPLFDSLINIWMLLFILSFFLQPYRVYGLSGPSAFVEWCTEPLCKRVRKLLHIETEKGRDLTPFLAIVLIILAKGVINIVVGNRLSESSMPLFISGFQQSFIAFINITVSMLYVIVILSSLLSKQGLTFRSQTLITVINDISFSLFRVIRKILKTDRLVSLAAGSIIGIAIIHALLVSLVSLKFSFFLGLKFSLLSCVNVLGFFSFFIILNALLSWFSPDPYNPFLQVVNAIAEPFNTFTRRLFPFARAGMIDFTPFITLILIWLLQGILALMITNLFSFTAVR